MASSKSVILPKIGSVELIIKTKREIRAHPAFSQLESESDEWWYWNRLWHSELALSEWLIHEFYPDKLLGKAVLELGCGTGLAGLVAAKLGGVPTFSDKVSMVMDSVKDACGLNGISNYRTLLLDWSHPETLPGAFDMVLGSEIFYDDGFLEDLRELLAKAMIVGGRGVFCDPNRLGFDSLQDSFSPRFRMRVIPRRVHWPNKVAGQNREKNVFVYEVM